MHILAEILICVGLFILYIISVILFYRCIGEFNKRRCWLATIPVIRWSILSSELYKEDDRVKIILTGAYVPKLICVFPYVPSLFASLVLYKTIVPWYIITVLIVVINAIILGTIYRDFMSRYKRNKTDIICLVTALIPYIALYKMYSIIGTKGVTKRKLRVIK